MSFKWTDNEIDNQLFSEFSKDNPDENIIRDLIKCGANINAIDCKGDSVLIDAISNIQDGLDIKFIQLIIDLGVNLDYAEEDFNCLYDAILTKKLELVELLLKSGANPNCVSTETAESLLDWTECDKWFEENIARPGSENMAEIVQLLKNYGAKSISEIFADKIEEFLTVFATYAPTGLFTVKGYFMPDNIPNADDDFIKDFKKWVVENPDKWHEYEYSDNVKITNPPDLILLQKHNDQGLKYAKQIKKLVGNDIVVKFFFAKPEDFEKHGVRNIEQLIIK